jgi:hypothetical protein
MNLLRLPKTSHRGWHAILPIPRFLLCCRSGPGKM